MARRPHIVIFNPDQWRGDALQHLGHPAVQTPNLDRMVGEDAVSFRHAYAQNPVCTPSRCSFMTGWYPHVRGHRSMMRMLHREEERDQCLLKTLKDDGYFVFWGGKNDLIPGQDGFEDVCDVKTHRGYNSSTDPSVPDPEPLYAPGQGWRAPEDDPHFYSFYGGEIDKGDAPYYRDMDFSAVEAAVEQIRNASGEQPLCLYLALAYPHPPYVVEQPWYGLTDRDAVPERAPGPDSWAGKCHFFNAYHGQLGCSRLTDPQWRELQATYFDQCARVDHQVGMIVEALREQGMYDDTAFFFFSDHGDYTGDYELVEKHAICFEDCLTRVPLIIKPPKGTPVEPGVRDTLVELVDFPATVEAVSGARMPEPHFGRSLLPVLADPGAEHREHVVSEGGKLEQEWRVIPGEAGGKEPEPGGLYYPKGILAYQDLRNLGKSTMLRTRSHKLVKRLYEDDELYDLAADPCELRNVAEEPAYAAIRRDLEQRLFETLFATSDFTPMGIDKRE